jgi:hypothetical protein
MENELFLITIIALMIKILMRKYKSGKGWTRLRLFFVQKKAEKRFFNFIIGAIKRPLQSFQPFKIPFLGKS